MNPYTKAVLFVLRLVAIGLIIVGVLLCGGDFYLFEKNRPVSAWWMLALKGLPILAGVVLSWKARGLAERWTEDLD
jgi:hypothetical protein